MPLPKTLEQVAKQFQSTPEDVLVEMTKLGVKVFEFLGHRCVYERDIYSAHHRIGSMGATRTDRVGQVERVLRELKRLGCLVVPMQMDSPRQIDCYQLRHREGGDKEVGIKVQVCSRLQRGGGIHFNLGSALLRDTRIDWFVMVAPPFAPTTDYLVRREHVYKQAKARGRLNKPSFPQRICARRNPDFFIKTELADILPDLGVGRLAAMRSAEAFDSSAPDDGE